MARYDDLSTGTIAYLTFMSCGLLAVTVLLLQALCYNWIDWQEDTKLVKQSYHSSDKALAQQRDSLKDYDSVEVEVPIEQPSTDPAQPPKVEMKKVPRTYIPIDRAKELLLEELKAKAAAGKTEVAPNT